MTRLSIRIKVLLIFSSLVLIGELALLLTAGRQLQQATLDFYQSDVHAAALNMASILVEPLEEEEEQVNGRALQTILERNQTSSGIAFTILDSRGRVLASTYVPRYPLSEALPKTTEIDAALAGHAARTVRASETGQEVVYAAVPVLYEGRVTGIVQASAPMSVAYHQAREKWYQLAAAALPILLLTVGASLWFGQTLTRPIKRLHASALRVADGALDERVVIKTQDEIGQLGQAFNFMAARINALLATQRSFVSNAAHELRAPLMSLKLRCDALQDPALSHEKRAAYQADLTQEINRMSGLITQLLILARLDEGRYQADPPPEDMAAFLQDLARAWRIRANAANLQFESEISASLPDIPVASNDLQIILENLLGNAVKYTPAGGQIVFRVDRTPTALQLTVRDTGEGFSPEEREKLFERFYRLARIREVDIPGTGLGLAIVKAILERYGGTISACSDGPNQGATFEVSLPVQAVG